MNINFRQGLLKAALVSLGVYGLVSVGTGARNALEPTQSQDLWPVYKASRLWIHRADPYQKLTDSTWSRITGLDPPPPLPVVVAHSTAYPPTALLNLLPVSAFPWEAAKRVWLVWNLLMVVAVPLLLWRLWLKDWAGWELTGLAAFWCCGQGLRMGLGLGQHNLLWFATTLACMLAWKNSRTPAAALWLVVSSHKIQAAAFIGLWIMAKRSWPLVGAAVSGGLLALGLFFGWIDANALDVVRNYLQEWRWWARMTADGTASLRGSTDLMPLFGEGVGRPVFYAVAGVMVVACVTLSGGKGPDRLQAAAFLMLPLVLTYNRYYATIVLIVPILCFWEALRQGQNPWLRRWGVVMLTFSGVLWLVDPFKIYALFDSTARLDQIPTSTFYRVLVLGWRAAFFAILLGVVFLQGREKWLGRSVLRGRR